MGGGGGEGAVLHMVHDSQFTENNSSLIRLSDLKSNLHKGIFRLILCQVILCPGKFWTLSFLVLHNNYLFIYLFFFWGGE